MLFKYGSDGLESLLLDSHLRGAHVTRSLGALWSTLALVRLFNDLHDDRLQLAVTEEVHLAFEQGLIAPALGFEYLEVAEELARALSKPDGSGILPLLLRLFIILLSSFSGRLFCFHLILLGFIRFINCVELSHVSFKYVIGALDFFLTSPLAR